MPATWTHQQLPASRDQANTSSTRNSHGMSSELNHSRLSLMNEAVEHLTDPVRSQWPIYDGNSIHITNRILITSHQTLLYFVLGVLIGAGYTSLLPLPTGFALRTFVELNRISQNIINVFEPLSSKLSVLVVETLAGFGAVQIYVVVLSLLTLLPPSTVRLASVLLAAVYGLLFIDAFDIILLFQQTIVALDFRPFLYLCLSEITHIISNTLNILHISRQVQSLVLVLLLICLVFNVAQVISTALKRLCCYNARARARTFFNTFLIPATSIRG
ncbi:hypothetical protein F5879DRAFT_994615 [Lentinula edodes]|nr:hypothetical protein F5879DRAFT_994615 [Lentinula edodes]